MTTERELHDLREMLAQMKLEQAKPVIIPPSPKPTVPQSSAPDVPAVAL